MHLWWTVAFRRKLLPWRENAFTGVDRLLVNAANADVAAAAVKSGAKKVVLYLNNIDESGFSGKTLTIPEGTPYFEFNGYGKTFNDLTIISNADETVINRAAFIWSKSSIPLQIYSSNVTLNEVNVSAPGIAMVLFADNAQVGLQGTINVSAGNGNPVLCKTTRFYESNPQVDGLLAVDGKLSVCRND